MTEEPPNVSGACCSEWIIEGDLFERGAVGDIIHGGHLLAK